ncbi:L-lactate utilization operon repressor [Anaerobiospirillum thomasii]|uniref:L-lactate utilization operon repressor n=1 Tax=Anaerobiospirillum thomasii TaxID=179995 RepID=A0A2X0VD71_9GAMM|nr:FadR/GntR family transcriptional regulator [Anaerobiospirillum thomasii]SPT69076.1 L-lactate utilization operon repressor [Anaerobiospirillum thomasii]SPT72374.1 L-lactate utilization operon repressor [Anaerobiospirillum thomasii]
MQEKAPLSEITASKLISYIVDNGFEQGQKLPNEKILCDILGVGRSTMREAVRMLCSRNILTVKHGSGIYIADNTGISDDPFGFIFVKDKLKLVEDLVEFRLMIEPRVAALAASRAKNKDIMELERLAQICEDTILANENHNKADSDFHNKLCKLSGNIILPKLEPMIIKSISVFIDLSNADYTQETIESHRAIVAAIKNKDAIAASDAMIFHLMNNRNFILKRLTSLSEQPQMPSDVNI